MNFPFHSRILARWADGARLSLLALWILSSSPSLSAHKTAAAADAPVDYNRDIKPILSHHCYPCHGPDAEQRQAELRLDLRDDAFKTAIIPGDPSSSPLWQRITSDDPMQVMPPADANVKPLTSAQRQRLEQWIAEGAEFTVHWAYVAPHRPEIPAAGEGWAQNPLDRFIAAGHAQAGLSPAPAADARTLARRLSFDLLGLPAQPTDVAALQAGAGPAAVAELVDRLLASPHFGERMAMFWLDLVRYGDTNGYHADLHRNIHPYRDYVIGAFNANLPFDQFTREQLAGDLLPSPTQDQLVASGYNRLNMTTTEGGAQAREYLAKYAADRVRNASTVWLGATLGCAECHDHKYDPFSTRDFYTFAAFFADLKQVGVYENKIDQEPQIRVLRPDQRDRLQQIEVETAGLKQALVAPTPELAAAQQAWEAETRAALAATESPWTVVRELVAVSQGGATLAPQEDGSILASGENPPTDTYTLTWPVNATITGLQLEALTHPSLASAGLSRANGNFVLTELKLLRRSSDGALVPVALVDPQADFAQAGFPLAHVLDGKPETGWAVSGHERPADHRAVFRLEEPLQPAAGEHLVLELRHESIYERHTIGRLRISLTSAENTGLTPAGVAPEISSLLAIPSAQHSPEQAAQLAAHFRGLTPLLAASRSRLTELEQEAARLQA